MKKLLLLNLALLLVQVIFAQVYPDCRDTGAKYPVDTCKLVVSYDFNFVVDTVDMHRMRDRKQLEIGNHINHYFSLYTDMIDSMAYNHYLAIPKNDIARLEAGINVWDWIGQDNVGLYCDIYSYLHKGYRLVSTRFLHEDYQYKEPIAPLEWSMTDQTDTIMGFHCLQTEVSFRGRKWSVWFAPDIPYAYGPWKFHGLPGLILKASDSDGMFAWTAIGLEIPEKRMIYNYAEKALNGLERHPLIVPSHKKVECLRKDIDRLWKRYWLAPMTMMFLDGKEHIVYDLGTQREVKIDINDLPNGYYPKLELDI